MIRSPNRLLSALVLVLVASKAVAQVESSSARAIVGGKRWAIVVGASNYEHYGKLRFAVADAKAFANQLKSTFGFTEDSVRLLTDDAEPRLTPTAGHVLGELAVLLADKRLDKGDLFIFYFSGHGSGIASGDYLLPADVRPETVAQLGVPVKKVVEQFVSAGLKNVLIICDACRSGASNPFGKELNALATKANIAVMQGCEPGQQSREDASAGRGLFTHHLIKNLNDPTVRDPESGALWARALAEKTSADVFEAGRRTYGKYAQKPTAWTNAKKDVLLGAFPSATASDAALKSFFAQAKNLDASSYAAALNDFAIKLFEADDLKGAVEAFRVLDQLGEMSPASRYVFSVALQILDRTEEADILIERFGPSDADKYYKDLSIASSLSDSHPLALRLACAERLWNQEPTWSIGFIRWAILKYMGDQDLKEPFLRAFLKVEDLDARQRSFLDAELLNVQGKSREAIEKYKATLGISGGQPDEQFVRHAIHLILANLNDRPALVAFMKESAKNPKSGYVWSILLAIHLKANDDPDGAMAAIKQGLAGKIDPDYLWVAVKTAGSRVNEVADEVAKIAKTMPLAWKAQLASSIATGFAKGGVIEAIQGFTSNEDLFEKNAEYNFEGFKFLSDAVEAGIAAGTLDGNRHQFFLQVASAQLTLFADRLEQDPEFWLLYAKYMLQGERNALLERVVDRRFDPIQKVAPIRSEIRPVLLMAYLNAGATEKAEALMRAGGIAVLDAADCQLMFASYLASIKRHTDARKALPKRTEIDASLHSLYDAVDAYLLVAEGKKEEGRKIALKYEKTLDLQANPMVALTFVALGDWERAEGLCNVSRIARAWGYGFLHFAAMNALLDHAREVGDLALIDVLVYENTVIQPENRLFSSNYFGAKPEIASFVGTYEFNLSGNCDWQQTYEGKLTLTISGNGRTTGIFESKDGSAIALSGVVDSYGVWTGKAKIGADECRIWARIAPPDSLKRIVSFKELGLLIQITKPNQLRAVWLCKPIEP